MPKKSFVSAPQPKELSPAVMQHYVNQGGGKDHVPTEKEMRLAFLLPAVLHSRFKSVCASRGVKMADEIRTFVERRTHELEKGS
jgi:hypothetical protein